MKNLATQAKKTLVGRQTAIPKIIKTPAFTNQQYIDLDNKFVAHNYSPLPVSIKSAKGLFVTDVEGRKYYDFLCGYSSNNQGHCHPKIVKALIDQARRVTMTSRAFHNDQLGETSKYLCELLGYDKMLPMNTGQEAVETSIKLARRWGYTVKGIPDNQASVLLANGNFHGRSITLSGACDDPTRYKQFGPFTPGFQLVNFNDVNVIKQKLENDPNICAVLLEPIQGELGSFVPDKGYLKQVQTLCKQHNVLLIIDEVQTGFGRTGKLMAYDWDGIKPDIVAVGKALSGGLLPVSAAFANDKIMSVIKPGEHGSTYGGNPLGMHVAKVAIQTLIEEGMVENSLKMGEIFSDKLAAIKSPLIKETRGRGLFHSIELKQGKHVDGTDFAYSLLDVGLLTKATRTYTVRFAPALTINESQLSKATNKIIRGLRAIEKINRERKKEGKPIKE